MKYRSADGRTFEADEDAFDENGILKDGKSVRVPVYMVDHASVEDAAAALEKAPAEDRATVLKDIGARFGRRSGYHFAAADTGFATRMSARDQYIAELNDAWCRDAPGDPCKTSDGKPGRLVTADGKLRCVALSSKSGEPSDQTWKLAGPLSDADAAKDKARAEAVRDAQAVRDAARAEYIERTANAWKR